MAEIDAKVVMKLRAMTNAGMMECKKALTEANGDMDGACELLRKWGAGRAEAKASNEMKEGLIAGKVSPDGKTGVLVRLGCQTDFVARNDSFQALLKDLVDLAFANDIKGPACLNKLVAPSFNKTVEVVLNEFAGQTLKENIQVTGAARFVSADGVVGLYVHHNSKVGGLVQIDGSTAEAAAKVASEVAMHVTAGMPFTPVAVNRDGVPADQLAKEREIAAEGLTGKPANIVEKIVAGKIEKFFEDRVLVEQPFVKDDKKRIRELVADAGKIAGATLTVKAFARYKVGEV